MFLCALTLNQLDMCFDMPIRHTFIHLTTVPQIILMMCQFVEYIGLFDRAYTEDSLRAFFLSKDRLSHHSKDGWFSPKSPWLFLRFSKFDTNTLSSLPYLVILGCHLSPNTLVLRSVGRDFSLPAC